MVLTGALLVVAPSLRAHGFEAGDGASTVRAACDANRLRGALERLELSAPGAADSGVNLTLTPSGAFQGLAYGVASDGLETHLAFTIGFEQPTLLRNPERPQLFALNLSRNDLGSDLTDGSDVLPLSLTLDPTLPGRVPDPRTYATLDNRPVPGGESTQRPGRGLDHLVAPCGPPLTDEGAQALQVLSRTVRLVGPSGGAAEVALFPGKEPGRFRVDGWIGGAGDGSEEAGTRRLAATLTVERDARDRLTTGSLTVHGPCAHGEDPGGATGGRCSTAPPGTELRLVTPTFLFEAPSVVAEGTVPAQGDEHTVFDWAALLAGTTWRAPRHRPARSLALELAEAPLVAVTAHPDDEVLLAPLLGSVCVELEGDCRLLVATRGEGGICRLPDGCRPDLGAVRSTEMARAADPLHAELELWGLPDAPASSPAEVRSSWAAAAGGEGALLARLAAGIEAAATGSGDPGTVLTFHPRHGSTGHPAHRALGALVLDAVATLPPDRRPPVYLLETRVRFTEDGTPSFRPDPEVPDLLAFDASRWMIRLGAPAWTYLQRAAAIHRSQFGDDLLNALAETPLRQRRVWLLRPPVGKPASEP